MYVRCSIEALVELTGVNLAPSVKMLKIAFPFFFFGDHRATGFGRCNQHSCQEATQHRHQSARQAYLLTLPRSLTSSNTGTKCDSALIDCDRHKMRYTHDKDRIGHTRFAGASRADHWPVDLAVTVCRANENLSAREHGGLGRRRREQRVSV